MMQRDDQNGAGVNYFISPTYDHAAVLAEIRRILGDEFMPVTPTVIMLPPGRAIRAFYARENADAGDYIAAEIANALDE